MRRALVVAAAVGSLLFASASATAQEADVVRIREVTQAEDGTIRLVVSVAGDAAGQTLAKENFTISENGTEVEADDVLSYIGSGIRPVASAIVLDTSGSMLGQPLVDAKAAAETFLAGLPPEVRVGLFTFDSQARVVVGFTTDRGALRAAISRLDARGETALYDGVTLAASELAKTGAQANMVVLSDGGDTVSRTTLEAARQAAVDVGAAVTTVALVTSESDARALQVLAADTGGSYVPVAASGELAAAFDRAALEITSQYVLTYRGSDVDSKQLDINVTLSLGSLAASDGAVVLNERTVPAAPVPVSTEGGVLGSNVVLIAALAMVGVALAALLTVLLGRPRRTESDETAPPVFFGRSGSRPDHEDTDEPAREGLRGAIVAIVDRIPKPAGYEAAVDAKLERAAWPLRASEFLTIRGSAAFALGVLLWAVSSAVPMALVGGVIGWFVPRVVLDRRIERRIGAFHAQLPDTLTLLAASLESGYGLMQGLDTVVHESASPTSEEFARTLTEIRLGMPVHDALDAMAARIGSEDFRWVVMSMNIQREVGGNLVHVLRTVSDTLREREQLRRNVKVLSAEGRLSGVILGALPFVMAVYIAVANPDYLGIMLGSAIGRLFMVGAMVLIGVGALWMRKIVRIEV